MSGIDERLRDLLETAAGEPPRPVNSGQGPAASRTGTAHSRGPVVYVLNAENYTVTPTLAATKQAGRPVHVGQGVFAIAITR